MKLLHGKSTSAKIALSSPLFLLLALTACNEGSSQPAAAPPTPLQAPNVQPAAPAADPLPAGADFVVRSRSVLTVQVSSNSAPQPQPEPQPNPGKIEPASVFSFFRADEDSNFTGTSTSGSTPVSGVVAGKTSFSIDLSSFIAAPSITNAPVSFGDLKIKNDFFDNNLKICGADRESRCNKAVFRAYTLQDAGVASPGDGLWNAVAGYGAPISMKDSGGVKQLIKLGQGNAQNLYVLPITKNVINYGDVNAGAGSPPFSIEVDFTQAGAGSYTGTLVLEYGLTQ